MRSGSRTGTPLRQRFRFRPLSTASLAIVWVILWGSVSPLVIVSGILLGYLIGVFFPLPPMHWQGRLRPVGIAILISRQIFDLTKSSLRVMQLVLARKVNLNAGVVRVDLLTDDDLYQVQVAEMISLVPGTVVIEVVRNPRRLYLHVIDLIADDAVEQVQEMSYGVESRVVRAFGSRQQIEAFDAARAAVGTRPEPLEDPELEVEET